MAAGAEVALLRNHTVTTNFNRRKTIQHSVVADPAIVSNLNIPRVGKAGGGSDDDVSADFGTK